ncbi:MAG: glutathione S-transferase family protein [Minwuia sp.]|nr:glutathione S-transferase family protein [Minwuia sp.]
MSDLILHHYEMSPFAEKVRLMFGLKGLEWRSVDIPNVMPKPDLMPLTGGYRKTPVLQIGADIYCDTKLIAEELERRHPEPTLMAGGLGLAQAVSGMAENALFWAVAGFVMGTNADRMPAGFHEDRAKMRGASSVNIDKLKAAAPMQLEQLRPQLAWSADLMRNANPFLGGDAPGLADLTLYHALWFLRNAGGKGRAELDVHPELTGFMERIAAVGHGTSRDMTGAEALSVAAAATPDETTGVAENAEGWQAGDRVSVTPTDYARDPVVGTLDAYNGQRIAVRRTDEKVGEVVVHFPRVGFAIRAMKQN